MVNKGIVAIIPARGGSKRIPRKNITPFFGKPLIAWTIEAAIQSNCFERIIVSTDDPEIAKIAIDYGAEVPFLRDQYADDQSNVSQVTLYTLEKLGKEYKTVCQLMPNCPIRDSHEIKRAIEEFNGQGFMISAFDYGWMNPWWAHTIEDSGAKPIFPDAVVKRSQDLAKCYCPTGAIWLANTQDFKAEKTFYGKGYRFFVMPWVSAVDIDNYEDLEMAQLAFKLRQK